MTAGTGVAIALAMLTLFLLVATAYYAVQTRLMVLEMRRQRETMATQLDELRAQRLSADAHERERYRRQIVGIRAAVVAEIRQIMQWDTGAHGKGRLYVRLSTSAWGAAYAHPEAFPPGIRARLVEFYDEVDRMNGVLNLMMLAHVQTQHEPSAVDYISAVSMGEERATWPHFMLAQIAETLREIAALPPPT